MKWYSTVRSTCIYISRPPRLICPIRENPSSRPHHTTITKITHSESGESLSEAMSRRVYDLKNDEELKAAYWEAARGGAAGAAKVWTFPVLSFISYFSENIKVFNRLCTCYYWLADTFVHSVGICRPRFGNSWPFLESFIPWSHAPIQGVCLSHFDYILFYFHLLEVLIFSAASYKYPWWHSAVSSKLTGVWLRMRRWCGITIDGSATLRSRGCTKRILK